MSRVKAIPKKGFTMEVAMAALLFCLPLLIPLHLLFNGDSVSTSDIFGFRWIHGFVSDEVFSWIALTTAMSLIYLFLFYQSSKGLAKLVIQPFIWYLFYNFLATFFKSIPEFFDQPRIVLIILSGVIVWWLVQIFREGILELNRCHLKSLSKNMIHACVIILAFLIRISNEFIPETWLEVDLGFMVVGSFGFPSFELFLWGLGFKLGLLLPLMTWFFYEKKWWKYALLSPILLTIYQLRSVFSYETYIFDEYEIIRALPFLVLIALILIALSKNAKDQYVARFIYEKTVAVLETKLNKRNQEEVADMEKAKKQLTHFKSKESSTDLEALLDLKAKLEHQLRKK